MADQKTFKERRKYARLQANVEVKYTVIGKPGAVNAFSKNISAGGLCILAEEQLVVDTPLQLEIRIPDLQNPIVALGRVVWQQKAHAAAAEKSRQRFDTGIEFTGISDFDRFNINRFVMEHIEP